MPILAIVPPCAGECRLVRVTGVLIFANARTCVASVLLATGPVGHYSPSPPNPAACHGASKASTTPVGQSAVRLLLAPLPESRNVTDRVCPNGSNCAYRRLCCTQPSWRRAARYVQNVQFPTTPPICGAPVSLARYPSVMSGAIASLLGALVGGLAAIGGAWLQARSTAKLQRQEAARQEQQRQEERTALLLDRRRILARRYLFQLGDAVDSLQHRVDNWAHRGGLEFSEGRFPGYWEVTSLYAVARALGAERILDLEGVYVELRAISPDEAAKLPQHAVGQAVTKAFGFFRYHRMALAESVLDRAGDEFRLLIYSEFLRRYEDPEWNLKSLLEPVREALSSVQKQRFETLEQSLADLSTSISYLTTSPSANSVVAL